MAFRWTAAGGLQMLTGGIAYDVSADGSIVVGSGSTPDGDGAFIWDAVHGVRHVKTVLENEFGLDLSQWSLGTVVAVSADGRVLTGDGNGPDGPEVWRAVLPDPLADTDGDGLLDDWEINGVPYTDVFGAEQRYVLDFDGNPGPDCDVNRKDIFVEVDVMTGFAPSSAAFIAVKAAFDTAPVSNPNGAASGIKLHIIEDELEIPVGDWTQDDTNGNGTPDWPTEFDALKLTAVSSGTILPGYFGRHDDRNEPDAEAIREAWGKVIRYCILGRSLDATASTTGPGGIAELGGKDFVVTMGTWNTGPTSNEHSGMFMHEPGHTLGLRHGGGDDIHYKPNYYSVMSYAYTTPKPWNTWPLEPGRGGFSRFALLTLNENALNECTAQVTPGSALAGLFFIASCVDRGVPHNSRGRYDIAMDWNQNGGPCEDPIADDINRLPIKSGQPVPPASPGETLHGHDDWAAIDLNFLDSPCFAPGVHNTGLGEAGAIDITFEENQALANALPPFCPGDIVDDRSVDVDDLIAVILAWGACPNGCLADITPLPADGQVDVDDLIAVILSWGDCP